VTPSADYALAADGEFARGEEHRTANIAWIHRWHGDRRIMSPLRY
jgi:hypothetical protein